MVRVVDSWPKREGTTGRAMSLKYSQFLIQLRDIYESGKVYCFEQGEDFDSKPLSFAQKVRNGAKKAGLNLKIAIRGNCVYVTRKVEQETLFETEEQEAVNF
jgi:hypothetical protein